jgi:hypothetical protein
MPVYEIPLSSEPQTFAIELAGVSYQLTFTWNETLLCWLLDVATATRVPIISGIPVVTGLDLLAQYTYLGFGGALVVQTDGGATIRTEIDGNSTTPIVGPGDWFIVGSSIIGGTAAIWGPGGVVVTAEGSLLASNTFPNDVPDFANLGTSGRVYFVVTP